jgi:hypothetical protein
MSKGDFKIGNQAAKGYGGSKPGRTVTRTIRFDGESKSGKCDKAGRPPREYDAKIFENLCRAQCTIDEIESILNTNQTTLDKWCLRYYKKHFIEILEDFRNHGKAGLRRVQFKLAETNAAMAIFLGKNFLGQTDQINQKIESNENQTIKTILELPDNGRRYVN